MICSILIAYLPINCLADKKAISVDYAMHLAELNSPLLSAAKFREIAARKSIDIACADYFPVINAEAIDSTGFPGSSGELGEAGLMGSPFRKGLTGGVEVQQTIVDFGRTHYNVEAANYESMATTENTKVTTYQVKQLALQIYYQCAEFRTLRDTWANLSQESAIITKEVQHFVNTGQVSIVDRYLSKAETAQALTAKAFFAEQLDQATNELSVLMGIPTTAFSCPRLPKELTQSLNPNTSSEHSPLLWRAVADANVAQAKLGREKAGLLPKIVAIASAGAMQETHDVNIANYSVGVGVIVPLLDLKVRGNIQRATALSFAKRREVAAEKLYLDETDAKYDRIIYSTEIRLQHLNEELQLARKAFEVAKERYFTLEGNLIDLREAFRNLSRVETDIENTRTQLLLAKGSKALLNGG